MGVLSAVPCSPESGYDKYPEVFVFTSGSLTDVHLWELAQRIVSEHQLQEIGLKVLKIPLHTIRTALYNKRDNINVAALEVLETWGFDQPNPEAAYTTLYKELKNHGWGELAAEVGITGISLVNKIIGLIFGISCRNHVFTQNIILGEVDLFKVNFQRLDLVFIFFCELRLNLPSCKPITHKKRH